MKDKRKLEATSRFNMDSSDPFKKSKGLDIPLESTANINVKSSAKFAELVVQEPRAATKKSYSQLVTMKAEEMRKKKKPKQLTELDDFNINILKQKVGAGEGDSKRSNIPRPVSEVMLQKYDGFLLRKSALKNTSKFPRERKMHTLSQSRLSRMKLKPMPNKSSIFESS